MASHKHYFPILTGKQGEFKALRELTPAMHTGLTPVFEVPPIDWDFVNEAPANSIDEQVADFAQNITSHWGTDLVFIDGWPVADSGMLASGSHPMTYIFDQARVLGLNAVPVTGLARDAAYSLAVAGIVAMDRRGVCIRVPLADVGEPAFPAQLNATMTALGVSPTDVDLVIDIGGIDVQYERSVLMIVPPHINGLPHLMSWRNLILAGTAFPENLGGLARNATHAVRRAEWHIWTHLVTSGRFTRKPSFSDYGISNPQYSSVDFRIMKMSAAIRYTHTDEWIVVKGVAIAKGVPSQYPGLARRLVALPQYMGRAFSFGDEYIDDCATGATGVGSPTTWRCVGTNHHLTFVVQQLASHPGL